MGEESFGSVWGLEEHQCSLHEKKQKKNRFILYLYKQTNVENKQNKVILLTKIF